MLEFNSKPDFPSLVQTYEFWLRTNWADSQSQQPASKYNIQFSVRYGNEKDPI